MLHLLPVDGQVEVTIDVLASHQEFRLSLCMAVDEARRHTDVDGLSGALGQTASATHTDQLSRSLGLEKMFSDPADSDSAKRSAGAELVVALIKREGGPNLGPFHEQ